jgi:uncharacterized protein YfkK (UPF0435 family)
MKDLEDIIDTQELERMFNGDHRFSNIVYSTYQIVKELAKEVEDLEQKVEELDSKVDQKLSTWEKLLKNEKFRSKSRLNQKIIWELVKIKENDSPKNQRDVAQEYDLSDARISQLKEFIREHDLP